MRISNCLKSVKTWLGLLWLGCALFSFGCAHDEDSSDDPPEHHRHIGGSGGGGRYGQGQGHGGVFDESNPFGSQSRLPGQ